MKDAVDAVIIGSGLGGLTAGALMARAGAGVLLLERHEGFGGAASTYRRGPLTVEASLHETTHPDTPGDPKRAVFAALDIDDDFEFLPVEAFYEVRGGPFQKPFTLPHGLDAVTDALSARFPEHERAVRRFLRQVRRTLRITDFSDPSHGVLWRLAHAAELPLDLWALMRDAKASLAEVMDRHFGDAETPKLALAANLPYYEDDPAELWWLAYAFAQGGYLRGGGWYVKGGSQRLSDRLVDVIRDEGGEALGAATVLGVELNAQGAVEGVRYRIGAQERFARTGTLLSNAAPHALAALLPEQARSAFMAPYAERPLSLSLTSMTLGLDRPAADLGFTAYSTQLLPDWMTRLADYPDATALLAEPPGDRMPTMGVVDYGRIDESMVRDGVHPVNVVCPDRYAHWAALDEGAYRARREAWADALVTRLDAEWPGLARAVTARTVATARTMRDYLNTPEGAVYGFAPRPPTHAPRGGVIEVKTPVSGLLLASAFAGFGGFTGAIAAGAAAAKAALAVTHSGAEHE